MARQFDGDVANYVTPQDAYGNFPSLAAKIELDSIPASEYAICGKWSGSFLGYGCLLGVLSSGKPRFAVNVPPIFVVDGATTLSTGTTYDVAGTYDGVTLNVYVDGVLDGTSSPGSGFTVNTGGVYRIGFRDDGFSFDGRIAEVGFWNRPLRAAEVEALAGGVSPSRHMWGLISHCPLWGEDDPEEDLLQGVAAMITGTVAAATTPLPAGSPWSTAG